MTPPIPRDPNRPRRSPRPVERPNRRIAAGGAVLIALVLTTALAACSTDASTRAGADEGPATTAAPVTVPDSVPAGTTLRIGDQLDYLATVLDLAGEDDDFPYTVEYSTFVGGPPMLQAFQGGALDSGFVASTPLIFAHAAGQDIVAIAGWASENGTTALVTNDAEIDGWDSLAGKRVAYQRGTSAEAAVLQSLEAVGLSPDDITTVDVPITQVGATLVGGSADAGISVEPLISKYLTDTPGAKVAARASEITDRASFLIATSDALDDPAKTAALADYTGRIVRAFRFLGEHPEVTAQSFYVEQFGLTPERAAEVQEAAGPIRTFTLPGTIVDQQQELADLFAEAGQIPASVDAGREFDTRFNAVVEQAQGS